MDPNHLADIEAIRQLKARYFRTLDQKDWDGYRAVFTADLEIDTRDDAGEAGLISGRDAYVDFLVPIIATVVTVHHGHMAEITITGPDTAEGIWAMEDHLWWPEESGMGKQWGTGWYEETYRREQGEWLISSMRLRRQRVEFGGVQTFPR